MRSFMWTDVRDPKLSPLPVPRPTKRSLRTLPIMSNPSRPTSPPIQLKSFRFSAQVEPLPRARTSEFLSPRRLTKHPPQPNNDIDNNDQKFLRGKNSGETAVSSSGGYEDPFTPNHTTVSSLTSYEHISSREPTVNGSYQQAESDRKRNRASLLVVASDAISFLGRKRKSIRQALPPVELSEVIDISAARRDEEAEERERLREAAAQSIGLGPGLLQSTPVVRNELDEAEELPDAHGEPREADLGRVTDSSTPNLVTKPLQPLPMVAPLQPLNSRARQGSLPQLTHMRSASTPPLLIPPFPTTLAALIPAVQASSTLPKYHPHSSLRIWTLSKQWKSRHMVLSSPSSPSRFSTPTASYLHLFKSSSEDEKELERLEINEDSIVFVAEEEVGGRKNVVKVGGHDVGARRKDFNHEEAGRTMWLLQMVDPAEAQKWITIIKNAILSQRSMRAGLGYHIANLNGAEPRGDMDVMLSMRAQGIISSPTSPRPSSAELITPTQSNIQERVLAQATSPPLARPQGALQKSASTSAVSTLMGFFGSAARPRSSSRATSIEQDRSDRDSHEESVSHSFKSSNLRNATGMSAGTASSPPTSFCGPDSNLYASSVVKSPIDRKIIEEPEENWPQTPQSRESADPANRLLAPVSSLQPPPRKRPWIYTRGNVAPPPVDTGLYNHTNGNASFAGSFGVGVPQDVNWSPASPAPSGVSFSPSVQECAASIYSISTCASIEPTSPGPKRMSRQMGILPRMLTPPSGPPPAIPDEEAANEDEARSRTSSMQSTRSASGRNLVSGLSTFSKRSSVSSAASISTGGNSHSPTSVRVSGGPRKMGGGGVHAHHRMSIPPPQRPAPTFAPPPAPMEAHRHSRSESYEARPSSAYRETTAQRNVRLSLMAPKPPPSMALPPRPDEAPPSYGKQEADPFTVPTFLRSLSPPFPPPEGPLPPPPPPPQPAQPAPRRPSLKQRLRILSSPLPSASPPPPPEGPRERPVTMAGAPSTPIGEKIMDLQTASSFESAAIPIPSRRSPDVHGFYPAPPDGLSSSPELTSLSPPPRRGSRQIFLEELEEVVTQPDEQGEGEGGEHVLTPRSSVRSLGVVSL